jgi:hypothetical protein
MTDWTSDELSRIGAAEEIQIASRRRDGSFSRPVTIWVVAQGDDLYVRSVRGASGAWLRGTQATREGRIRVGGKQQDVSFEKAPNDLNDAIDAAYRSKYRRYAGRILNSVLSPEARSTTIQLMPRSNGSRS